VIFGIGPIAQMIDEEISRQNRSDLKIVAFTADDNYITGDSFCDKPLLGFQRIEELYPPGEFEMLSTSDSPRNHRGKMGIFKKIKEKGYKAPNFISLHAYVSEKIKMGENNIIMPFAYIGSGGIMEDANFIRQNTYLGHDFVLGSGNTITSGCSIAGYCTIGNGCYIGIGATIIDHLNIADETFIGAGAVVINDTEPYAKYVGNPAKLISRHEDKGITINMR